jgi:hypothetical protein
VTERPLRPRDARARLKVVSIELPVAGDQGDTLVEAGCLTEDA